MDIVRRQQILEQLAAAALDQQNARERRDGSAKEVAQVDCSRPTRLERVRSKDRRTSDGNGEAGQERIFDGLIAF